MPSPTYQWTKALLAYIRSNSWSFSRAAMSSLASENSPSSMPSPTYQWTKALLAYIRSNLWSSLAQASAMAVALESMQTALWTLARSPARDDGWWLVVDPDLEAGGTPVNELHGPLALDGGDGRVDVLGDDISPVEHAAGHVLPVPWVALHHGVGGLEASVGDLSHGERLVVSLLSGDNWGVRDQGEMNPGVGHQVGLELVEVHVESSIKPQGGRDGGHNLGDEPVEVGVGRPLDVEVPPADVVDGLVVDHEGTV